MAGWDWTPYTVGGAARPDSFSGLDPNFNSALQQMFQAAPENIRAGLRITSGYRSPDRQAQLFADAVRKYGSPAAARKWVAPPGNSKHNHGQASDLKYLNDEARQWAHANAQQFGLNFPLANEDWHIEPIGARGKGHNHAPAAAGTMVANAGPAMKGPSELGDVLASAGTQAAPAAGVNPAAYFGDVVAPAAPADFSSVIASYMAQRNQQAEKQRAEEARRQALLGSVGDVFG